MDWTQVLSYAAKAGDLLKVEITDADEYDLFAKLISVKTA